jgi:hypothetical protein
MWKKVEMTTHALHSNPVKAAITAYLREIEAPELSS